MIDQPNKHDYVPAVNLQGWEPLSTTAYHRIFECESASLQELCIFDLSVAMVPPAGVAADLGHLERRAAYEVGPAAWANGVGWCFVINKKIVSRWWVETIFHHFSIFTLKFGDFNFHPNMWGNDSQFDEHIFRNGLVQPSTRPNIADSGKFKNYPPWN